MIDATSILDNEEAYQAAFDAMSEAALELADTVGDYYECLDAEFNTALLGADVEPESFEFIAGQMAAAYDKYSALAETFYSMARSDTGGVVTGAGVIG